VDDDDELITEDWLKAIGFVFQESKREARYHWEDSWHCRGVNLWQNGDGFFHWAEYDRVVIRTRGKLRQLFRWLDYDGPVSAADPCL
jgi:hypothetical protein